MKAVSFGRANLQVKTEMPAGLSVKSLLFFPDFSQIWTYR